MTTAQPLPPTASASALINIPYPKQAASPPRIALIHATPLAIQPIQDAFKRLWPEPSLMNLLDDSLSLDHAKNEGVLSNEMVQRFVDLAKYVKRYGAQAILFTCSAFGPAIEIAAREVGIPTMKPNQAMFEEAIRLAPLHGNQLALIATFQPSLAPMCAEFATLTEASGSGLILSPHHVPEAMALLAKGEAPEHHRLIADHVAALNNNPLVLLAQFSMAAAQSEVAGRSQRTVLTSPDCAVTALKNIFSQ
jgi:hypothetical protein